ncbi:MAG: MFS transporter [Solirubrobacterales bacterium]|nr:MFS transporter [Solirubrobacterales bacterium]
MKAPPTGGDWDPALRWRGLAVVCAAMVVSAVDMTIVNVALPDISRDLDATLGELQWVLDGFLVALAGTLAVASGIADRFGRRRVFLAGMAAFAVASVLCAAAPSPGALIAARVLMGVAVAFVLPPALSLLTVMFEPGERPRALGIWTVAAGLAMALGPVLGGALIAAVGWPGVFLVNVPVAAVAIPAGLALLPESRRPDAPALDVAGAALSVVALGGLVFFLVEGAHEGWGDPAVVAALAAGLAGAVAVVARELRADEPLLDVRVLVRPRVAGGVVALLALYASFLGVMFLVPQYLQYVQERTALAAGVAMFPVGLGVGLGPALRAVPALARLGARASIAGGLAVAAVGCLALMPFGDDTPLPLVGVAMLVYGAAFGFAIIPATATILNDLPPAKAGDGSAANQLARQVGGALGIATVGSLSAAIYASEVGDRLDGFGEAVREAARSSIGHAEDAAARLGPEGAAALLAAGDAAFDAGARAGLALAAAGLAAAAVFVAWALRGGPATDAVGAEGAGAGGEPAPLDAAV